MDNEEKVVMEETLEVNPEVEVTESNNNGLGKVVKDVAFKTGLVIGGGIIGYICRPFIDGVKQSMKAKKEEKKEKEDKKDSEKKK